MGILCLGVLPVIHLFLSNEELDTALIQQLSWHQDTFALSWKTGKTAIIVALISSVIGWSMSHMLRSARHPYLWIVLYVLGFTISPYVAAQGWIQMLGAHGSVWDFLGIPPNPDLLYGTYGMVFLMCLQFIPLALLVFVATQQPVERGNQELQSLIKLPLWKKIFFFHLPDNRAPLLFALVLIFWLAFWNYETPSILRQNTYALSVYAAFGSFYDYNQALGYLLHATVYAIPALFVILWLTPAISTNIRSLSKIDHPPAAWAKRLSSLIYLCLVPLCGLLFPAIGLIADLDSLEMLTKAMTDYSGDIRNTLVVASSVSIAATLICVSFACLSSKVNGRTALSLASIILLIIPSLCTGIGAVHWFAEYGEGEAGLERIILVNIIVLLPILLLPISLGFPRSSQTAQDTRQLFKLTPMKRLGLFLMPVILPRLLVIFGFGFLMTMREVPASLLNYPPDGSTLALTIETILHFDQPKLISSLCLIQLLIAVIVFTVISLLIHFCKR